MADHKDDIRDDVDPDLEEITHDEESVVPEYRQQSHPLAYELVGLQRVVNAIRLYGVEHSRAHAQTRELLSRLRPLLREVEVIQLEVTDGALLFGEMRVVEEADQGGIVDELFRDGIRVLSLRKGIEADEFLELLSILGTNFHLPQYQEDTLQGLLWAADLPHVSYEAVQGIEEAVEDSADAGRGESVDFDLVCKVLTGRSREELQEVSDEDDRAKLFASLLPPGEEERFPTPPELPGSDDGGVSFGPGLGEFVMESADDDPSEQLESLPAWAGELQGGGGEEAEQEEGPPADRDGEPDGDDPNAWGHTKSLDAADFVEGRVDQIDASPEELLQIWEEADGESTAS